MHNHSEFVGERAVTRKRQWRHIGMGLVLLALIPVVVFGYLGRNKLREEALKLLQPELVAYNQLSLGRSVQQTGAAGQAAAGQSAAAIAGPLRLNPADTRYFVDPSGKPVYLTGSHTWASLQDNGAGYPPPQFDYTKYLDFLTANHHNFFRLWSWEQSRWTLETADDNYWFNPDTAYVRTGPGNALDGKPKWDLTKLNQAYFDRMRQRIIDAGSRGIYVSVMLFDGWSVVSDQDPRLNNPWKGHPFNAANNINGINGDANNDNNGRETHTLAVPAVTAFQEAYVKKVIDTVGDLDNVLYEIDNEGPDESLPWQKHMVDYIRSYEAGKAKQHPIGVTGRYEWSVDSLLATGADWISPGGNAYQFNPPANTTKAVIINDTDHLWGIGGDRAWVWKNFTRGLNPIFMDCYDGAGYGVGGAGCNFSDPTWVKLRANMGYTNDYARAVNLAAVKPHGELCSTGYCLASPGAATAEYLVYQPTGNTLTVNLAADNNSFAVEWLNPDTGAKTAGAAVQGGATRTFTVPFSNGARDAVLYLREQTGAPPPTPTPTPQPTFPSTPLLDNFNRPNGRAGTRWIDPAGIYRIRSQRLTATATGQAFWQPGTFGVEQEAYAALAVLDKAAELGVLLKVQQSGSTMTGAVKVSYVRAGGVVRVATYTQAGGWKTVGTDVTAPFIDGDKLGARVRSDGTVELYKNGGLIGRNSIAGWQYAGSGGRIGVYMSQPALAALDNFGGGNYTTGPVTAYALQVVATTEGQGSVTVEPQGAIACGQQVTIQAAPDAGWVFTGWDGDVVDSANPLTLQVTGSLYLTARFQPSDTPADLQVTAITEGNGKVVVEPPGPFMNNQAVKLTAQPDPGWIFDGWDGVSAGNTDNPLAFNVTQDANLTAKFVAGKFIYIPLLSNGVNVKTAGANYCE